MKPVVRSPLRYPGGKARLFPFVANLISQNSLFDCDYAEPFAGGAGLALNLLFAGFCNSISLNDLDPAIFCFWHSVTERNDAFCELVEGITFSIDEWYTQREKWESHEKCSPLELGFAAYYLNRTNRSGIIEGAGPIGGYKQLGNYRMDARFSMGEQLSILKAIGSAASAINVTNLDAVTFIKKRDRREPQFLYLDPPYYVKGQRLYRNSYAHNDHVEIAELVRQFRGNWMVSYDDVIEIRDIYSWSQPLEIQLQYSAGPVAMGKEVIFLCDRLRENQRLAAA